MSDDSYRQHAVSSSGVYPNEDFTGEYVEYYKTGQLKFRGTFHVGRMRIGLHMCFWENGILQEVSFWLCGWNVGTLLRFREDGSKLTEMDFGEDGGQTQTFIEKRYGCDSRLIAVDQYEGGTGVSKWLDPIVANAIAEAKRDLGE